jgi:hypothetical protein
MAKISKKLRNRNHNYYQNITAPPPVAGPGPALRTFAPVYDANQYIKKDLTWSALVGGLVVLIMALLYFFLR